MISLVSPPLFELQDAQGHQQVPAIQHAPNARIGQDADTAVFDCFHSPMPYEKYVITSEQLNNVHCARCIVSRCTEVYGRFVVELDTVFWKGRGDREGGGAA